MSKRAMWWLIGGVAAIVVAGVVVVAVIVGGLLAAVQEADYRACLAARGLYDSTDIDRMVDLAESCDEAVYG